MLRQKSGRAAYPHLSGFESTHIFGSCQDVLDTTRHIERWREDLSLLYEAGIRHLRYSIPWQRIEAERGEFDWSWMDGPMRWMEAAGLCPVVDPLHHTSFPEWLTGGFLHPEFPNLYGRFLNKICQRYPWISCYTVFNEPLPTTLFCSYTGMWYPHGASERKFVSMAMQVGKAICCGSIALKQQNAHIELVYIDTAEHHQATDRRAESWAEFVNDRRFLILDLVLGRIRPAHPLYFYLLENGASTDDLHWFWDHPAPVDVLGLDYYLHSEMEWRWDREQVVMEPVNRRPRGFAGVARDYIDRFRLPVLLSETNIRGTVADRLSWLKFMEEQCEQLVASGQEVCGFYWYPAIDCTDWSNCCTQCTKSVDPQGIWWLDSSRTTRHTSELSRTFSALAKGEITPLDMPAYVFGRELRERLRGYLPLMNGWRWVNLENGRLGCSVDSVNLSCDGVARLVSEP